MPNKNSRIESREEIKYFLEKMKYGLDHGAKIIIQFDRNSDKNRNIKYTNKYAIANLFSDKNPVDGIKGMLKKLNDENYIRTLVDLQYPHRSELREFGIVFDKDHLYIKLRAELFSTLQNGGHYIFVLTFHFAEIPFADYMFPYKKEGVNLI